MAFYLWMDTVSDLLNYLTYEVEYGHDHNIYHSSAKCVFGIFGNNTRANCVTLDCII